MGAWTLNYESYHAGFETFRDIEHRGAQTTQISGAEKQGSLDSRLQQPLYSNSLTFFCAQRTVLTPGIGERLPQSLNGRKLYRESFEGTSPSLP